MNEFTEIFWSLTVKENQDIKFFNKAKEASQLDTEKNKEIIDKLEEQQIYKIKFLGDEAINYPNFIELLKYAGSKGIKSELLFYDVFDTKNERFKEILRYIDGITLSVDSLNDKVNTKLGKSKNYFKKIEKILRDLMFTDIKINIDTIAYSLNFNEIDELGKYFVQWHINTWRLINFNSMLIKENINLEKIKLSKVNYQHFAQSANTFCYGIKFYKDISDRVIENCFITIIPNGDAVVIYKNDTYKIGNILNDKIEVMLDTFKNKKRKINQAIKQKKITLLICTDNKTMEEKIKNAVKRFKYAEIVAITNNGIDTYKKILKLKPDMVFLKYGFEDMSGYDIMMKVADKLELDTPIFNILKDKRKIEDSEISNLIAYTHKLNAYISEDYDSKQIRDIVKQYKEYIEF